MLLQCDSLAPCFSSEKDGAEARIFLQYQESMLELVFDDVAEHILHLKSSGTHLLRNE